MLKLFLSIDGISPLDYLYSPFCGAATIISNKMIKRKSFPWFRCPQFCEYLTPTHTILLGSLSGTNQSIRPEPTFVLRVTRSSLLSWKAYYRCQKNSVCDAFKMRSAISKKTTGSPIRLHCRVAIRCVELYDSPHWRKHQSISDSKRL